MMEKSIDDCLLEQRFENKDKIRGIFDWLVRYWAEPSDFDSTGQAVIGPFIQGSLCGA